MTSEQAEWLAEAVESIVADPAGWLAERDIDDVSDRTEFLADFASIELAHQVEAKGAKFREWCAQHNLDHDNDLTKYVFVGLHPRIQQVADDVDGQGQRMVELAGYITDLDRSLRAVEKVLNQYLQADQVVRVVGVPKA
jgi:hypothetical protein